MRKEECCGTCKWHWKDDDGNWYCNNYYTLPPVTPTERIGEWVNSKGEPVNDRFSVYCSRCKAWSEYRDIYCGNCGAKMGGEEND